jgi:alpha-galactosidase
MMNRRHALVGLLLAPTWGRAAHTVDFRQFAPTPPMGWNSWDSFGPTIDEEQVRANAHVMAEQLLPHGYRIFTIDIQWYEPGAHSYEYRKGALLSMDAWGRLCPAPNRFPSSVGSAGFKPLADFLHGLGLQFGLHMMRGLPRQAVAQNTPIFASHRRAADIADTVHVCDWNTDMFGIDMSRPGAQEYYDSVVRLYASWGVDFLKADDMSRPYFRNEAEIHAVRRAIDRCGRPMILSLSPGETPLAAAADVSAQANLWRISDDFWDTWPALREQFSRLRNWSTARRAGNWPDADMLPLGTIALGRPTRFSPDEQRALMTLWSIARSPLIMGGDLRQLDAATHALLTNDEVIEVNQHSQDNHQLFDRGGLVAWSARDTRPGHSYLALFNLREGPAAPVPVSLASFGLKQAHVRDLWAHTDITVGHEFSPRIAAHGAGLFRLAAA